MTQLPTPPNAVPGSRAEVIAWTMYDWANSAYSTILITIFYQYLTAEVFDAADPWGSTLYAWGISVSMLTAAVLSPILGALADANRSKRRWLAVTALGGAAAATTIALVPPSATWLVIALFVAMSLMFELSLGFYNGFLPEVADERTMNRVSALGYAVGYLGGALALILAIAVGMLGDRIGLADSGDQLRVGIGIMGLWWGLFSVPTLWVLRDRGQPPEHAQPLVAAARKAVGEVGRTLANIRRYKMLMLFLLGFLFYNDGIQTVLSQASVFATKVPELSFSAQELALLVLVIQFAALPGALLIGFLSDRMGQKPMLLFCLAVWIGLLVAAYFVSSKTQFWILGGVLALVMGGTQAVSRAIMGYMTPPDHTAEFFGFFNLSGKATSFMGPFLFGGIFRLTGDPRAAILSLLVFFFIGMALVVRINIHQGRRQAVEGEGG